MIQRFSAHAQKPSKPLNSPIPYSVHRPNSWSWYKKHKSWYSSRSETPSVSQFVNTILRPSHKKTASLMVPCWSIISSASLVLNNSRRNLDLDHLFHCSLDLDTVLSSFCELGLEFDTLFLDNGFGAFCFALELLVVFLGFAHFYVQRINWRADWVVLSSIHSDFKKAELGDSVCDDCVRADAHEEGLTPSYRHN